jgi:putative copper export protein
VNLSPYLIEFLAISTLFIVAMLLLLRRNRVSSRVDRIKMHAAAWSLLSDTGLDHHDDTNRRVPNRSREVKRIT